MKQASTVTALPTTSMNVDWLPVCNPAQDLHLPDTLKAPAFCRDVTPHHTQQQQQQLHANKARQQGNDSHSSRDPAKAACATNNSTYWQTGCVGYSVYRWVGQLPCPHDVTRQPNLCSLALLEIP
jgi:hypothetical protein